MDQKGEIPRASASAKASRRKSIIGSTLALAALALLGWLAWHLTHPATGTEGGTPGARRGPPPTTVGVAAAIRTDLPVMVEALGTVTASAAVTVRPQVAGALKAVLFTEGEMVRAGQLLATIDDRQLQMALLQATGQRQRDEAQLENARLTLERYQTLLAQDSIARQEVDTQAALVKQLEGTVAVDRAVEGTARINLGYTRITAPISGRVGLRSVDVGNLVAANDATGIADITQVAPIDVEFSLPQDLVPALNARLNARATLPVNALDRNRETVLDSGSFLALDNQIDTQTGTVRAKARFANAKSALFPSQFVNVRLLLRTITDAVVVPVNAVRHGSNGDFVYVLDPAQRTVSLRNVTRGEASTDKIQITSGLKAGEQVITEGADRLKDGASVSLPGERPGPPRADSRRQPGPQNQGISTKPEGGGAGSAQSKPPADRSSTAGTRPQ